MHPEYTMKTVYLVRHGKAAGRDTEMPDFERTLIERGRNDSMEVAERLQKQGVNPSLIISSPAARAIQTARIFAENLKYPKKKILTRKALYDQTDDAILDILHSIDDEHDTVMLVGHDPSFSYFAGILAKNFDENLPTCGVVGIECKIKTWTDIAPGQGKKKIVDYPGAGTKTLSYKLMKKQMIMKIREQIGNYLIEIDADTAEKMKKSVKKASENIAGEFLDKVKKTNNKRRTK